MKARTVQQFLCFHIQIRRRAQLLYATLVCQQLEARLHGCCILLAHKMECTVCMFVVGNPHFISSLEIKRSTGCVIGKVPVHESCLEASFCLEGCTGCMAAFVLKLAGSACRAKFCFPTC